MPQAARLPEPAGQVHEPAALGVDRHAGGRSTAQSGKKSAVRGQGGGVQFGVATTEVDPSSARRQTRVAQRGEGHHLCPQLRKNLQVLWVVEGERGVLSHRNASALPGRPGGRQGGNCQRRRGSCHRLNHRQVEPLGDERPKPLDNLIEPGHFTRQREAQVPLWEGEGHLARERTDNRETGGLANRLSHQLQMTRRPDAVCYDADKVDGRVELPEAEDGGGGAASGGTHVSHQDHGRVQELGNRGGASLVRRRSAAIVEPHHALDQREIRPRGGPHERAVQLGGRKKPAVEGPAGTAGCVSVEGGINEVGSHLEGGDGETQATQGGDEAKHDARLADARVRPRHRQAGQHVLDGHGRHSGGNPHVAERTPPRTSRTHRPAWQPLAGHWGVQKCLRPQGKQ